MIAYAKRPFLAAAAEADADRARALTLPVALVGRPASGTYRVARALHRDGSPIGFVSIRSTVEDPTEPMLRLVREMEGDPGADLLTLYLEGLEHQSRALQDALLRLIDEGLHWRGRVIPVRVVVALPVDPATLRLAVPALAGRLAVIRIPVSPLAERQGTLVDVVAALASDVATRLGLESRWLAPEAVTALADRSWPGDVEELEIALARLLVSARGSVVTYEDVLGLGREPAAEAPRAIGGAPVRPGATRAPAVVDERRLEILVTELAHELKNPMVTIKTFAQHIDRLLEDPETRSRFVSLTGEAIDRMDGFLEELLGFSRFREPHPQVLPLQLLVGRSLAPNGAAAGLDLSGDGIPPGAVVVADEEQVSFALRALVRAFRRRLPPDAAIVYQWAPPGGLRFDYRGVAVGIALQNVVDHEDRDEISSSLDFFLAENLIERNRGHLRVERDAAGLQVRLQLPPAGAA